MFEASNRGVHPLARGVRDLVMDLVAKSCDVLLHHFRRFRHHLELRCPEH
jgi:hypothetical protein